MRRWIVSLGLVFAGLVSGAILVVSCSDSMSMVDAADGGGCPCPPAEKPFAGRVRRVEDTKAVPTGGGNSVKCEEGTKTGILLGGGCRQYPERNGVFLITSGIVANDDAITCKVQNTTGFPTDVMLTATAICLFPE
jgi:hypothetical protein